MCTSQLFNYSIGRNTSYENIVIEDKPPTKKTYTWPNGDEKVTFMYEGDVKDNKREGKGILFGSNGDRYEGDFDDDKITGKGSYVWADGGKYEGVFFDGQLVKGVRIWADGSQYEGDFHNYQKSGKGSFIWANGDKYVGDFNEGYMVGNGIFSWANGNRVEGDYFPVISIGSEADAWAKVEESLVRIISKLFEEQVDREIHQKEFTDWSEIFLTENGNVNMKRWMFNGAEISKDNDEKGIELLRNRISEMQCPSEKSVIFEINKNKIINLINIEPDGIHVSNAFGYSIYLEAAIDNCSSVEFAIEGERKKLPKNMSLRLIKLLQEKRGEPFCCIDFVNFLCGKFKKFYSLNPNKWRLDYRDSDYSVGDAVALGNFGNFNTSGSIPTSDLNHYAIYVGSQTFISVYGSSPIIFSSLEQMKKHYNSQRVLKMNPV